MTQRKLGATGRLQVPTGKSGMEDATKNGPVKTISVLPWMLGRGRRPPCHALFDIYVRPNKGETEPIAAMWTD